MCFSNHINMFGVILTVYVFVIFYRMEMIRNTNFIQIYVNSLSCVSYVMGKNFVSVTIFDRRLNKTVDLHVDMNKKNGRNDMYSPNEKINKNLDKFIVWSHFVKDKTHEYVNY